MSESTPLSISICIYMHKLTYKGCNLDKHYILHIYIYIDKLFKHGRNNYD